MTVTLDQEFIDTLPGFPAHMTPVGKFTALRTYSRYLEEEGRRETWKETIIRASRYNVELAEQHLKRIGVPIDYKKLTSEAMLLIKNQFNLKQALSGRTLWVGGANTKVADKFPLSNFNCAYEGIEKYEDLAELFYMLLVGTGVGFKTIPEFTENMPPIRDNFTIVSLPYEPLPKLMRQERTSLATGSADRSVRIHVGDSKEGWVESLKYFFMILTEPDYVGIRTIELEYNSVRKKGERLKTFGGTASGYEPLKEMFELFYKVIHNTLDDSLEPLERTDATHVKLRPIHIADMANAIGYNVVVGGVRRTAEILLFSGDPGKVDFECLFMKFGINGIWGDVSFDRLDEIERQANALNIPLPKFFEGLKQKFYDVKVNDDLTRTFDDKEEAILYAQVMGVENYFPFAYNPGRKMDHRRMSNNSMAFHTSEKPSKAFLDFIFLVMQGEGEPGFVNLYEASRRRLAQVGITDPAIITAHAIKIGLNPCAEILLYSKSVCNLTTVNVRAFVSADGILDLTGLIEAQKLSVRSGLRMTLVQLELPEWDAIQQRDRLLGNSLTGVKDAMGLLGYDAHQEKWLLNLLGTTAREEADRYAKELRIPAPLLTTTVKPEGTLSIVFGMVSSGLHVSHSPRYIRRIRINAEDPLAKASMEHKGWTVNPEVGTPGETREEQMTNARTLVIDFPVLSGATKTKAETDVNEQFDTYFTFQSDYTEHNSSNTVHLQPHEWGIACERVYNNWENFVGVSFLALDGGSYLLAPYEDITQETYEQMVHDMQPFDEGILRKHDRPLSEDETDLGNDGCENGICPIR